MTMTDSPSIPSQFLCALTGSLMKEPMMSKYGHRFDRSAIFKHLNEGSCTCPITQQPLRPSYLITDSKITLQLKNWLLMNPQFATPPQEEEYKQVMPPAHVSMPPARFICPLTKQIMQDPVMTKTGVNYERRALLKHLQANGYICPVTCKPLHPSSGMVINAKLQFEIQDWTVKDHDDAGDDVHALLSGLKSFSEDLDKQSWGDFSISDILGDEPEQQPVEKPVVVNKKTIPTTTTTKIITTKNIEGDDTKRNSLVMQVSSARPTSFTLPQQSGEDQPHLTQVLDDVMHLINV